MANTPKLEHDAIAPNLHVAAKWLRENLGFDIVVSPRFNSNTGIRVGYFWRISQRTDLRDDKVYKSYENALEAAIRTLLAPFYE